ncbi:ABC transporter permease [Patescibacteria group bacterium]|nr:ABC transporter permease [Patescibacteria group bacterium]
MSLISLIKSTFASLKANPLRTGLASLGIVIGISSVIIVYAAGEGVRGLINGQVEAFGTNLIETEIKIPSAKQGVAGAQEMGAAMATGAQVTTLKIEDMVAIDKIENISQSYAGTYAQEPVSYGNEMYKTFIWGASANYINIDNGEVVEGRFYTEDEDKSLAQVVVIGTKIKEKLFGESDAIGKYIKIRKSKYRVIGVMKERGVYMGMLDFDDMLYIPVKTAIKKILGVNHVLFLFHEVIDMSIVNETVEEIRQVMRVQHGISDLSKEDFRVTSMAEAMDMLDTIMGALELLLLAIVAISLIVGGVGIMNIMYATVSEREFEIGLRKSIGATNSDIIRQFLLEAIFKTTIGGILGVFFGVGFSYLIAIGARGKGLDWVFSVPLEAYVVSFGFSVFFGLVFGVLPAKKAANLNPVEALRTKQ